MTIRLDDFSSAECGSDHRDRLGKDSDHYVTRKAGIASRSTKIDLLHADDSAKQDE
jgi:hypothetical protein